MQSTLGHQPILSHRFAAWGDVSMIDFHTMPDGYYKFLLNNLNCVIKLSVSNTAVSKREAGVAATLLSMFCLFRPLVILQFYNGREFVVMYSIL
jgi:hypothetical protein